VTLEIYSAQITKFSMATSHTHFWLTKLLQCVKTGMFDLMGQYTPR